MQEKNSISKARGSYIITIPSVEEERIRDRKMWHILVSRHNRHMGNLKV